MNLENVHVKKFPKKNDLESVSTLIFFHHNERLVLVDHVTQFDYFIFLASHSP